MSVGNCGRGERLGGGQGSECGVAPHARTRAHPRAHPRAPPETSASEPIQSQVVEQDVDGIDINMGCPKKFSVQGGMGAALLKNQAAAEDIVRTLAQQLTIPVSVKIRHGSQPAHQP